MLSLCIGLIFIACKKTSDSVTPSSGNSHTSDTISQQTNGGDDARMQNESDAVAIDAEAAISGTSSTMRTEGSFKLYYAGNVFSGATVDTTNGPSQKSLVLTYDGLTSVGGRVRSGTITVTLTGQSHWSTPGAVLTLTFNNYKVTYNGKSITFNGNQVIINKTGGDPTSLAIGSGSITSQIRSNNIQVTFDDGTIRTWYIARTRTITRQSTYGYTISTTGDTSITVGNTTYGPGVAAWGTTRLNSPFYSIIDSPIVWNTADCFFAPVSGSRTIQGIARSLTITYGVDSNGNVVTPSIGTCPYGIKINWTTVANSPAQAVMAY